MSKRNARQQDEREGEGLPFLFTAVAILLFFLFGCIVSEAECGKLTGLQKDICFMKEAIRQRNIGLCGLVTEQNTKDACYHRLAALPDVLSIAICEKIVDENTRVVCYCDVCKQVRGTANWNTFGCDQKCPEIIFGR